MMFLNHGAGGLVLYAWIAWLLGARTRLVLFCTGLAGFLLGAAPDIVGWWDRVVLGSDSWQLRNALHDGPINDWMQWTLAWGLHTWLDSFIHPYTLFETRYHIFEAVTWVVYAAFAALLVLSYQRYQGEQ